MGAISLYARASPDFPQKLARSLALLRSSAQKYSPLTQASSLGAEDMVVTHLLEEAAIDSRIFVLDTGMLHAETVALIPRIEERYLRHVSVYHPDLEAASAFVQTHGSEAMYKSLALRKACCHLRKMEPLERALAGKKGWITGMRREQSTARAEVHDIEQHDGRAKINPLADWTWGDVWHYIALHEIPFNPLHDQFFPSIGCAPCTRAVTLGEDVRSGRWWWEQESARECGLHASAEGAQQPQEPPAFEPVSHRTSSITPIREILA